MSDIIEKVMNAHFRVLTENLDFTVTNLEIHNTRLLDSLQKEGVTQSESTTIMSLMGQTSIEIQEARKKLEEQMEMHEIIAQCNEIDEEMENEDNYYDPNTD